MRPDQFKQTNRKPCDYTLFKTSKWKSRSRERLL